MASYSQVALYDTDESHNRSDSTSTDLEYDEEFEVLVNAFLKDMDYSSTSQAVFNIVYSIINSGLIALPFACYLAGIPTFITIVGGISLISGYVSIMVIAMANEQRVRTLEDLAQCAFGPNGFILVCAFQMVFSFSLMVVTLSIFAEIMSDVFEETSVTFYTLTHRRGQVLIGAALILPLCILKKSMSSLRWTSYFTVMVIAAALIGVVTVYVTDVDVSDKASTKRVDSPKAASWSALLIVIFCYSYNQKVFMIYSCLRRRTVDRWGVAVKRANMIISVLYIVFGTFGYVSRDRIGEPMDHHDYFIDNRDENKIVFDVARIMVAFCLLLTIPVDCLVGNTTFRRIAGRYTNSKFEKKLNKHLCCKGWFGSSKGSDTGSFNSRDEEDGNGQRSTSEDLLIASRQNKPRSASGSKKYMKNSHSGGVTSSGSSSSLSGGTSFPSSASAPIVPVSIVKKGTLPTENVPIPAPDVSGGHSGLVGSIYRSLLMTPPQPTMTEINTNLNSIQNENIIQEALSHSYENNILRRLASHSQTDGSYNVGQSVSYNSSSSINAEIMSSLHKDPEDPHPRENIQASRPRDGSGISADLEDTEDKDQFNVDGLRERGGANSPMSPSKRSVSFVNDSGRVDLAVHQALMNIEDPYDYERQISSGVNSADGVKMNHLMSAANSDGSDSTSLMNTQSSSGRQTSGGSGGSGGVYRKDHHSNEGMVRIPAGGGSTHTLEDLERSFSTQGGDVWVKPKTLCPTWSEVWPGLVLWLFMTVIAFLVEEWLILATIATIATVILLFIFPTMFYFRLGLASDFQASPVCGMVPNRFFMMGVQFVGISILLYEAVALMYNLIMMGRVIHHQHN